MAELVVQAETELPSETKNMMQSMAAVKLYRAQREVANYFELAYLQLGDYPDIANKVRLTATSSRAKHMMTTGLMKKFTVTADQIVETMIPMILEAIDLQDPDMVKDIFDQILELADSMKKEAEDTQASYHKLQYQVQTNMSELNKTIKHVMTEEKKREIEIEREKVLIKAAQLKEKQLQNEKQKMDEDLIKLQTHRDNLIENTEETLRQTEEEDDDEKTFLDDALAPGIAFGGRIGTTFRVIKFGVNTLKRIFGHKKNQSKVKTAQEAFNDSQDRVEKMFDKNQEVDDRIHTERVDALNRLAKIKELALAKESIGNAESLREASAHLGDVDKQFTRMIQFWSSMAAILKYLKDDTNAEEVYLKGIKKPQFATKFKMSVERSKQEWKNVGCICKDFIKVSKAEISTLYAFLSAPIGKMPAAEREIRMQQLMQDIEDDIYSTYPQR